MPAPKVASVQGADSEHILCLSVKCRQPKLPKGDRGKPSLPDARSPRPPGLVKFIHPSGLSSLLTPSFSSSPFVTWTVAATSASKIWFPHRPRGGQCPPPHCPPNAFSSPRFGAAGRGKGAHQLGDRGEGAVPPQGEQGAILASQARLRYRSLLPCNRTCCVLQVTLVSTLMLLCLLTRNGRSYGPNSFP